MTKNARMLLHMIEQDEKSHHTSEQLYFKAKVQVPSISMGTVYRNLGYLSEHGYIRKITVPGKADSYEKISPTHDHLICDKCGRIIDVFFKDLRPELEAELNTSISGYALNIHYICDACKEKGE